MTIIERIRHNMGLKVLSLVFALVIWGLVHNQADPIQVRHRTVAVEAVDVPDNLAVASIEPAQVSLTIRGRASVFTQLDYSEFRVVAHVTQTEPGSARAQVEPISAPPGLEVLDLSPRAVKVALDAIISAARPVFVELRGDPAEGYTAGQVTVRPRAVTVSGPSNQVQRVARVLAEVDITGRNASGPKTVTLTAQDATSLTIASVQIKPAQATVTVQIKQVESRTVPIVPIIGSVPHGYEVEAVTVRPVVVTLTGAAKALTAIDAVQTAALNVTRRSRTSFTVPLRIPQGLFAIGPASAQVTVTLRASGSRSSAPTISETEAPPAPATREPPATTPPAPTTPEPPATQPEPAAKEGDQEQPPAPARHPAPKAGDQDRP